MHWSYLYLSVHSNNRPIIIDPPLNQQILIDKIIITYGLLIKKTNNI